MPGIVSLDHHPSGWAGAVEFDAFAGFESDEEVLLEFPTGQRRRVSVTEAITRPGETSRLATTLRFLGLGQPPR